MNRPHMAKTTFCPLQQHTMTSCAPLTPGSLGQNDGRRSARRDWFCIPWMDQNCWDSARLFCGEKGPPFKSRCNPDCVLDVNRKNIQKQEYLCFAHLYHRSNLLFCLPFSVLPSLFHSIHFPTCRCQHTHTHTRVDANTHTHTHTHTHKLGCLLPYWVCYSRTNWPGQSFSFEWCKMTALCYPPVWWHLIIYFLIAELFIPFKVGSSMIPLNCARNWMIPFR